MSRGPSPSAALRARVCGLCGAGMLLKRLSSLGEWFWWCTDCETSEDADQTQAVEYLRQVRALLGVDLSAG